MSAPAHRRMCHRCRRSTSGKKVAARRTANSVGTTTLCTAESAMLTPTRRMTMPMRSQLA